MSVQFKTEPESRPGIYKITCVENGRCYIGQSVSIRNKWHSHRYTLNKGTFRNNKVKQDIRRGYSFTFEVLEYCDYDDLGSKETFYIRHYNAVTRGYNKDEGGDLKPNALARIEELKAMPAPSCDNQATIR